MRTFLFSIALLILLGFQELIAQNQQVNQSESETEFTNWLKTYIPESYSDSSYDPHHGWYQVFIPEYELTLSWGLTQQKEIALKKIEGLSENKAIFIAKADKVKWADDSKVDYSSDVGYNIPKYNSSTMGTFNVGQLTIVQFDGEPKKFVDKMVKAYDKEIDKSELTFHIWLKEYVKTSYPVLNIDFHGGWYQSHIANPELTVTWGTMAKIPMAIKELHGLRQGKSIFIEQDESMGWEKNPGVTFIKGLGYYVSKYDTSSMGDFEVGLKTVIQFDGENAEKFIERMGKARQSPSIADNNGMDKPRVLVTSDGEIDDECSMVRFLLYANEWDIEGIITSSSQYHWHGHKWAGDDWLDSYLEAYAHVYPNLLKHSKEYPTPDYLKSVALLGNVETKGEMDSITPGSQHIAKVMLDESDNRPIWVQAWGGTNTIARALKTIEEEHPEKMEYVANKLRFFFIWEQDSTYQAYIRPHWGKYNIPTIICDQFWAIAYQWDKVMPEDKIDYFKVNWMKSNILEDHGALCSLYQAYKGDKDNEGWKAGDPKQKGSFRSEGDSPAFIHIIPTGLRSSESPDYGGWGGRYVKVRENTWLDPVSEPNYTYPEGRWYTGSAWGRNYMRNTYPENQDLMNEYFKPITRWADALQNDFAARADWCIVDFENANHPPVVKLSNSLDINAQPDSEIQLSAKGSSDPDGDELSYIWWQYMEVGSFDGNIEIINPNNQNVSLIIPDDANNGETIHIICEVTDNGSPRLTRYQRVIIKIKS